MQYQTFSPTEHSEYPICFLVPKLARDDMAREYIDPACLDEEEVIAYQLHITGKKTKVADQKEFLDSLLPMLDQLSTQYLVVSDGEYFKTLTGAKKADAFLGYVVPNTYPESMAGRFNVIFCPNYRQVFYNPGPVRAKITQAMDALWNHRSSTYEDPGNHVIHFEAYPTTVADIASWLQKLIDDDRPLAADIETYSLKHYNAGIGTISFAWNQHEGIAFPVDMSDNPKLVRSLLKKFFIKFHHKIIWHKISFDVTVLIYQLFMDDICDTEGLLNGIDVMLENWDCTRLIAYLATNTCAGNNLSLKDLAQEHAGNYAVEEIKDITKIPLPELLTYNLVDTMSTWYTHNKYWDKMVADDQLEIYTDLFQPAIVDIVQMQLTGMPLDMDKVAYAKSILKIDLDGATTRIQDHKFVREFTYQLNEEWVEHKNTTLKVKRVTLADAKEEFNPNSSPKKMRLLYEMLGLPKMDLTKTKQPSTSKDALLKLKAYTEDPDIKELLQAFVDFAAVEKIYSTFIPAMESAVLGPDGCYYLFGDFNLGGTVSGRLSSSGPNLQTIPAKGKYAKLIKDCFRAPKGWLMIGLDFASLEDRISALTTKDPNKLKVYTDGFDGHCLRALSYFKEKMLEIQDDVASVNSIKKLYPELRDDSKVPTFLLTYGGTHIGMVAQCDFTMGQAKEIEARYHNLYQVSDQWVADRIQESTHVGYVTCAFGLRVRTPLLSQVIMGTSATPYEAQAEGRTAGNALGQSWCLLNTRASVEFMAKARKSKYRLLIKPIAHIHDAQYMLIPDDIEVLMYVNEHLVKAVEWQDHPDIEHPQVKLGGELGVFYPSWANEIVINNGASKEEILDTVADKYDQYLKAA